MSTAARCVTKVSLGMLVDMSMPTSAVLEGGPADLPERIVPISPAGSEIKIPFKGGYEHFKATTRHQDTPDGRLPVYEWVSRTKIAE